MRSGTLQRGLRRKSVEMFRAKVAKQIAKAARDTVRLGFEPFCLDVLLQGAV